MDCTKKLIVKINGNSDKDLLEAWAKPSKELNGTTTVYLKNAIQAHQILSEERIDLMKHVMTYSSTTCVFGSSTTIQEKKFICPKIDSIEIRFK